MKKVYTVFAAILFATNLMAQTPEKLSYQAVIRNASNQLVTNQAVGMQISILQGSASGTAVYVETHSPTTNGNGLVSVEIGGGVVINGDFSAIDWANSSYFVKMETDPSGGTSYTIEGTNQLLSVPYALHAKTAENLTGNIVETDPVYSSSQAANITSSDITNLGNLSGVNTGDQDLSFYITNEVDPVYSSSQASNITYTDITKLGNLSGVNTGDQDLSGLATKSALEDTAASIRSDFGFDKTYSVGDFAQGGVVFWVDETGRHGLACAIVDQSADISWYNGSNTNTEALGDGAFSGEMNTMLIIANQGTSTADYAAGVCSRYNYSQGGVTYGDYYLPSKYELNLMYLNKLAIDATATANGGSAFVGGGQAYWSSTEEGSDYAWRQYIDDGTQGYMFKYITYRVRAIRAF